VLYRDNTSTPGEPNSMQQELDMGTRKISNLGSPVNENDALRLRDLLDNTDPLTSGTAVTTSISDASAYYSSTNVEGALEELGDDQILLNIESIADLRLLDTTLLSNNDVARVLGYYGVGTGGANILYWDDSSTETDNGGSIVQVTGIATGRFKSRDLLSFTLKMFGCKGDGVTNDAIRMQAAFDNLESIYVDDEGEFVLSSSVTIPQTLKKIYGKGSILVEDNVGFDIPGTALETLTVTTITDTRDVTDVSHTDFSTRIVVSDLGTVEIGERVRLYGDSSQSFFSEISSIDVGAKEITLSDKLTFTIGTNPKLDTLPEYNCNIREITLKHTPAVIAAGSYLINIGRVYGIVIEDCIFTSTNTTITRAISHIGGACIVRNNSFDNVSLAIQFFDSGQSVASGNIITKFKQAIRCVRTHESRIVNNKVFDGLNQNFGVGIELTAESVSFDKNCWNLIEGNTVINANHGVAGSAIGGIHLNFNGDHNIIKGNTIKRCSIGIYLENNNNYNTITGNNSSYNDGYYGVGIELDWDNDYNTVSSNICNYNQGSITAFESSGIQVRANRSSVHAQIGNIITGNDCNFNGLEGIRANGIGIVVIGNSCISNGQMVEDFDAGRGIYVDALRAIIQDNYVYQDVFDSRATSAYVQVCLQINDSKNILVSGNILKGISYAENAIEASQATGELMDNIRIENNIIDFSGATGNAIKIFGYDAGELADYVVISNNTIDMTNNGLATISSNFLNNYTVFNNSYPTYKSLALGVSSTNRITQADD